MIDGLYPYGIPMRRFTRHPQRISGESYRVRSVDKEGALKGHSLRCGCRALSLHAVLIV